MPTLVIPDIHEKYEKTNHILTKYEKDVDHTVFLGDFYDNYILDSNAVVETARLHKESLNDPKRTVIFGNHDLPYRFKNIYGLKCSGHDVFKYVLIDSIVKPEDWDNGVYYKWEKYDWLLSHAGINIFHQEFSPDIRHNLETFSKQCELRLKNGEMHFLVEAGYARGGPQPHGGITWQDWKAEFKPTTGINQIVGHTNGKIVRSKNLLGSNNYCIDTDLNNVVILDDDGSIEILDVC